MIMPHFTLARFLVLTLIRFINIDVAFFALFKNIFSFLPFLVKNVGIIPVFTTIWTLLKFLRKGLIFKLFPKQILDKLNPVVLKTIMEAIEPF